MYQPKASTLTIRAALLLGAALVTTPALAGYELLNEDGTKLTFNFDAVIAGFVGDDSWFGASKEFLGGPTNNWVEYGAEPRLSLETPLAGGTVFGQLSAVATKTGSDDASGLTIGINAEDADVEQANLGWKIDNVFSGLANDTVSISAGRQDYLIGTGMLIADGHADGGERGGWYIGMRKSFQESVIARLKSDEMLLEGFRLENQPRDGGTEGDVWGINGEYVFFGTTRVGLTYMEPQANNLESPYDEALDIYNGRLDWTPEGSLKGVKLSGEYAHEENDIIEADGWYTELGYQFEQTSWTPTLSYRYAYFEGDDPDTSKDEEWRSIAYGFTDYGSWYQGEITGNYPLGNSNLISNRVRLKVQPLESITMNLMYYDFTLDQQQVFGDPVSSDDWGDEIDLTLDWTATDSILVIGVLGYSSPGDAAKEWTGGDKDWLYGMLYLSYSY
jgi:hypothetical protein